MNQTGQHTVKSKEDDSDTKEYDNEEYGSKIDITNKEHPEQDKEDI
jgi:hypothetical protein